MSPRSTRLFLPALLSLAVLVGAHPPLMGQSSGPGEKVLLGTWRLDLAKSKYFPGPAPRSETRVYTADQDGVLGVINRVHADGRTDHRALLRILQRDRLDSGSCAELE